MLRNGFLSWYRIDLYDKAAVKRSASGSICYTNLYIYNTIFVEYADPQYSFFWLILYALWFGLVHFFPSKMHHWWEISSFLYAYLTFMPILVNNSLNLIENLV